MASMAICLPYSAVITSAAHCLCCTLMTVYQCSDYTVVVRFEVNINIFNKSTGALSCAARHALILRHAIIG